MAKTQSFKGDLATGRARIFYGWYIAAGAFAGLIFSMGIRSAFGPFLLPMIDDLDLSRTMVSLVVAASMVVYAVALPLTGRIVDAGAGRRLLIGGALLVAVGLYFTARAESWQELLFWYGFTAALGFAATGHVVFQAILNQWFVRRRGAVLSLLSAAAMGGMGLMTPAAAMLVEEIGWRGANLALATAILVVILPVTFWIIRDRPEEMGLAPDGDALQPQVRPQSGDTEKLGTVPLTGAIMTAPFWMLSGGYFSCGFSMNLLGTHGVPMLIDHGFSPLTASGVLGIIGMVGIIGSIGIGIASDRFGRSPFLALIYLVRAVGFVLLLLARTPIELYLLASLAGLVWVGSSAMTSALTADIFGRHSTGTLFGWIYLTHQVGGAAGVYLGGWAYDRLATHAVAFGVCAALLVVGSFVSYRIPQKAKVAG
jgi:MFS family permease